MLKFVFLINPIAGGGKGKKIFQRISEVMKSLSFSSEEFHLEFTQPEKTILQAKKLAKITEKLIAVGGDGTAAQVIAGAYQSGNFPLIGIIPLGVGNDLARVLGIYDLFKKRGVEGCIQQFLKGYSTPLDLWRVNEKEYIINYLGIGFDARIVHSFSQIRRLIPFSSVLIKKVAYAIIGFFYSFSRLKGRVSLTYWTGKEKNFFNLTGYSLVVISNIPLYAGGTLLVPEGNCADGLLEITLFPRTTSVLKFFIEQKILGGWGISRRLKKLQNMPGVRVNLFQHFLRSRNKFGMTVRGEIPKRVRDDSGGEISKSEERDKVQGEKIIVFQPPVRRIKHYRAKQIEVLLNFGNYLQIDGEDKTYLLNEPKIKIEYQGQVFLLPGN